MKEDALLVENWRLFCFVLLRLVGSMFSYYLPIYLLTYRLRYLPSRYSYLHSMNKLTHPSLLYMNVHRRIEETPTQPSIAVIQTIATAIDRMHCIPHWIYGAHNGTGYL